MTIPDPNNPHEASRRWHEKFEHLPPHPGPEPEITGVTVGGKGCIGGEEHLYIAWHEPEHNVYWIRTCAICGRPDWDALDDSIRVFIGERLKTFMIKHPNIMATDRTGLYGALRSLFELEKLKAEADLTNPEGSGTL